MPRLADFDTSGKLRIFQRQGRRYAVKLEDIFWTQLKECAADAGQELTNLVFEIFDADPAAKNRTALLRSYCLTWLRHKLTLSSLRSSSLDLSAILTACPAPCFVITQERQLTAYNPAFAKEVWGFKRHSTAQQSPSPLNMSFSKPFNKVVEALDAAPGKIIQGQMGFSTEGRQLQCRVNFCLLDDRQRKTSPILIYID
ncbi:MAG: ribbon-helix-helix domain-containing protein [Pseudomonadota bacterium]